MHVSFYIPFPSKTSVHINVIAEKILEKIPQLVGKHALTFTCEIRQVFSSRRNNALINMKSTSKIIYVRRYYRVFIKLEFRSNT